MEQNRRELNRRRVALGAFAKSVKKAGKFEWGMTVILFLIFGGFIAFFAVKFMNLPDWALYVAFAIIAFLGFYVGYEIYLSRVIRGNELKSFLEMSSLLGHVIEKLERIELALGKELDLVIGIKKDVVKDEEEKRQISKVTAESVQKDIAKSAEDNMVFKYCPNDKEEVYVSKAMTLCPFCWNALEEMEQNQISEESTEKNISAEEAEPIKQKEEATPPKIENNDDKKDENDELIFD